MNNFYGILKITEISDIIIDYYNKCKFSYEIICIDKDIKFKIVCNEKFIEKIYSKLEVGRNIFVYGKIKIDEEDLYVLPYELVL